MTGREVDAVGRAIIEDAYSATSHDVRHQSAMLLARSPYAPVLAKVLIEQTQPNRCFDGAPGVLPYVVGKAERDALITRLDEPATDLRQTLVTLAHVPGGPVPGVASLLNHPDTGVAHAALFTAGMQEDPVPRRFPATAVARPRCARARGGGRSTADGSTTSGSPELTRRR